MTRARKRSRTCLVLRQPQDLASLDRLHARRAPSAYVTSGATPYASASASTGCSGARSVLRQDAPRATSEQSVTTTCGSAPLDAADELLRVAAAHLVVLRLHAPRAVDGRALLDDLDLGVGQRCPSTRARRVADLLRAQVAGRVVRDLAEALARSRATSVLSRRCCSRSSMTSTVAAATVRASSVPRSSGHSFRIMYPHVGCERRRSCGPRRPRATSDATFARAFAVRRVDVAAVEVGHPAARLLGADDASSRSSRARARRSPRCAGSCSRPGRSRRARPCRASPASGSGSWCASHAREGSSRRRAGAGTRPRCPATAAIALRTRRFALTRFATRAIGPGGHPAEQLRLAEHVVLQRDAVAPRALRLLAHEQPRDVEQPRVPLVRRVRALDVAELALPAELRGAREGRVVELLGARRAALLDVAVDAREHVRERAAVADAHPAAVADLERRAASRASRSRASQ